MRIEVLNWDKFNPRKDVTKASWFRLSHDLFENPDFFDFTHTEIATWIYILSIASKKSAAVVHVNLNHAEKIGRIRPRDFHIAIEKLKQIKCIAIEYEENTRTLRERSANVTYACTTNERTNVTNETNNTRDLHSQNRREFDFDALYKKYPRKDGKSGGMKICRVQIKSPEDYAALSLAIDRYSERCKREVTEKKYIKHFSTFMGAWRDFLEADSGTAPQDGINWERVFGGKKDAS